MFVALSAVGNFGIIARQRTLLYPMFLVLPFFRGRKAEPDRAATRGAIDVLALARRRG